MRCSPNEALAKSSRQRDKALSELRLAYLFRHLKFGISLWDPPGANGMTGEFLLSWLGEPEVFSGITSRGWKSELTKPQIDARLAKLLKYDLWNEGAVGNWQPIRAAGNPAPAVLDHPRKETPRAC